MSHFTRGIAQQNPVWVSLLGLCPLLAVSQSVANALGLALASALVLVGSNTSISLLRRVIPDFARLPCFVLLIATFTTLAVLLLEAYAYDVYQQIALFVQIIVTNCMILARAESFARFNHPGAALLDALGTATGFAIALLGLGAVREILGYGTLFAGVGSLFGLAGDVWTIRVLPEGAEIGIVLTPPGAFLTAGLLLALGNALRQSYLNGKSNAERGLSE